MEKRMLEMDEIQNILEDDQRQLDETVNELKIKASNGITNNHASETHSTDSADSNRCQNK
jgi:hypothetical protein